MSPLLSHSLRAARRLRNRGSQRARHFGRDLDPRARLYILGTDDGVLNTAHLDANSDTGEAMNSRIGQESGKSRPEDLKVFISHRDSQCDECQEALGCKAWICLAGDRGGLSSSARSRSPGVLAIRQYRADPPGEEPFGAVGGRVELEQFPQRTTARTADRAARPRTGGARMLVGRGGSSLAPSEMPNGKRTSTPNMFANFQRMCASYSPAARKIAPHSLPSMLAASIAAVLAGRRRRSNSMKGRNRTWR